VRLARVGRALCTGAARSPPSLLPIHSAMSNLAPRMLVLSLVLLAAGCVSLDYDLSSVPVPVSAKPAEPGQGVVEPFRIEARSVLWCDGLFGRSTPDVAALVRAKAQGSDRIASFRVGQETNFHQWLLTHLTLSLVRMKTVVIEGELVRERAR
jgi:hypothetical protein